MRTDHDERSRGAEEDPSATTDATERVCKAVCQQIFLPRLRLYANGCVRCWDRVDCMKSGRTNKKNYKMLFRQ